MRREHHLPLGCLVIYGLALIASGIDPVSRYTWLFENLVPFVIIALAVLTYRRFRFSDRAYVQGLAFLLLHTVATWYTYPLVPFGNWLRDGLDLSRNHYDRIVHFGYGLLLFVPVHELAFRREPRRHLGTELFLVVGVLMSLAVGYEILEWWADLTVNSPHSDAFVAAQGDRWDPQQDLFVALLGATLAATFDGLLVFIPRGTARSEW